MNSTTARLRQWRPHLALLAAFVFVVGVTAAGRTTPTERVTLDASDRTELAAGSPLTPVTVDGSSTAATAPDVVADDTEAGSGQQTTASSADDRSTAAPTATASAPSAPGVTDQEILIGGSTFTSGPAAVYGEQIAVGFTAGVRYVNEHGGVNGRRLRLQLYDDAGDPARQLANTKRLVEVDKVFALSMVYAPTVGDYVSSKGIPVVHLGQFDEEFTNPNWFPVGGPQRLASYQLADFGVHQLGVKSVAVFYLDAGAANYSKDYAEQVASDWKAYGVDVPVLVPFAPDQTSCSDAIGQASAAGVDFIQFEIDASKVINCGVEAQIQQYKPPKGWGGYLIGVPVIHEALGDYSKGMYAFDAFGAIYDQPAYQEAVAAVSQKTESYSSVTVSYFVAALLLRDALASLGDNITRAGLADAINHLQNWRPDLTDDPNQPTWTWTPECHVALRGGYVIQIQEDDQGDLRWTQITPQADHFTIPPGQTLPERYAGCRYLFQSA